MDAGLDRLVVGRAGGVDAGLEDQVGEGEDDCGVGLALSRDGSHHPLEDLSCVSSLVILDMERVSRWETSGSLMLVM